MPNACHRGRGRGVQAGYSRPGDGAVQLHGRGGWGRAHRRRDPRLGRQPLWDRRIRRHSGLGRRVQAGYGWPRGGALQLHGRRRWALPRRRRNPRLGIYGTTEYGGTAGLGKVFKVDTAGQETLLYSFTGGADGGEPFAGVIRDSAGNLYGTTLLGGATNAGVVYKLDTAGKETLLYSFTGCADGREPFAGVIRDSAGNLYGTTLEGGTAEAAVFFKLDTAGQQAVLYSFTAAAAGSQPYSGVIRDSAGNLYGTTLLGGATNAGVVFKVNTAGKGTVLHTFTGGADGGGPYAGVIRDSAGNLYGTTSWGGTAGAGVVYKLDPAGRETVLYNFTGGADGSGPQAGVIRDTAGNLYGTTVRGGATGSGVVYKLDMAGHETVLYSFTGGVDGD